MVAGFGELLRHINSMSQFEFVIPAHAGIQLHGRRLTGHGHTPV